MSLLVSLELIRVGECLATYLTSVLGDVADSLAVQAGQVILEMILLDKFLITVVAVKWFFTSVKPFLHSQVVLLDEFLVTVEWF